MRGADPVVSIASKNLFHDRTRLAVSAGGVGFAIMLVLILAATYDGVYRQAGLFVENSGADLFVGQAGVVDTLHSFSILPLNLSGEIAALPGVERVCAIISRTVEAHVGDTDHPRTILVGYNGTHGTAGPWRILEGSRLPAAGEIVVDEVLARKDGLGLGSEVRVGSKAFRISGISGDSNMFIMQYAFVRFEDIQGVVLPPGTATYFLVKVAPGSDAGAVRRAIEDRWAEVAVFTVPEMASNNREVISGSFLPILLVLYVIGFVIGIVVIGLTVYTATMERAREYGILKAIGAGNARLARVVLTQAAVLAVLGFLAGLAITAVAAAIIDAAVPEMTLYFAPATFPQVFAAALGMSAVATALPLGRLVRIDPASIFRRG